MCDLIDLHSPDKKDSLSSRLASPLIPVPTDVTSNNNNTRINTNEPSFLTGKRDSLENNPFDMVLHKTTEYIQKKDDPFEITLEKALTVKCKKNASSRSGSLDLPNNQALKEKKNGQKLKMNKTLGEILINDELNLRNTTNNGKSTRNAIDNLNNTNISNNLPTIDVQDSDLSILNQSVMDDTLFEESNKLNKNEVQSTLQNKMLVPGVTLQVPKFKRSFSQGETPPDMRILEHQISLAKSLKTVSNNESSISSLNSPDILNEGFFKSDIGSSVFSSLSNISSISKVSSVSSIISPSLILSNGTMNRTFLESCSFEKSENTKLTESKNCNEEIESVLSTTKNLDILKKTSLSDLTDRFNKLKARVSGIPESCTNNKDELTCSTSSDIKQCVTVTEKNETCDVNNKLIDVDVFTPDNNSSKEHCKSSISDTSSDSVFLVSLKKIFF